MIQPSADALLMKTETIYTDNGNYIVSQKDARGNIVTNTLDEDGNGRVEAVTDPQAIPSAMAMTILIA
ncbi:MAG: hypothetical protein IJB25_11285 [Clostridia bacterium]|nr:hypothetical protein [Clostridia bacterium]